MRRGNVGGAAVVALSFILLVCARQSIRSAYVSFSKGTSMLESSTFENGGKPEQPAAIARSLAQCNFTTPHVFSHDRRFHPLTIQAVVSGAFDDRHLSFDSSGSDTDMRCFEHKIGDARHNFSHHPGCNDDDEEEGDGSDDGSEENFFEPDPSDPADGGLPCLSRRFFAGSATAAVS